MLAGCLQKRSGIHQVDAELGGQGQLGMFRRHAQADQQVQVLCRCAIFRGGRFHDLGQFFQRIETVGLHAMIEVSFANGAPGLHRVHEAQRCAGQRIAHHPHFGDGGDVIVRHARFPQDADQIGGRIGLYGIHRLARKLLGEETGRARCCVRTQKCHGFVRLDGADYSLGIRILEQFKGPPNDEFDIKLPCGGNPLGQRSRAFKPDRVNCK